MPQTDLQYTVVAEVLRATNFACRYSVPFCLRFSVSCQSSLGPVKAVLRFHRVPVSQKNHWIIVLQSQQNNESRETVRIQNPPASPQGFSRFFCGSRIRPTRIARFESDMFSVGFSTQDDIDKMVQKRFSCSPLNQVTSQNGGSASSAHKASSARLRREFASWKRTIKFPSRLLPS